MDEALPSEIRVEESDGVVCYTLPRRTMSLFFGGIPIIVGSGMTGAGLYCHRVEPPLDGLFFVLFGVLFPLLGAVALWAGILAVLGRVVIQIDRGRLRFSHRVFGLGWWRSRDLAEPFRIEAERTPVEINDVPADLGPLATLAQLVALGPGRRRSHVATSYDLRLLRPLAAELNRRMAAYRSPMQ